MKSNKCKFFVFNFGNNCFIKSITSSQCVSPCKFEDGYANLTLGGGWGGWYWSDENDACF